MSFLSTLAELLIPGAEVHARSATDNEAMNEQLATLRRRFETARPWRVASVDEALAVPSIFSAVTLIASTMGTLSMDAYRNERLLAPTERPRLIIRPNPLSTPYAFFFLSAFYKATRGERWWWIASRDIDGTPLSLFPVPPWEIRVSASESNRLRPKIEWGDKTMPNEDMVQDIWFPDSTGLRGEGPLQKAGAAVSVTVESQEWAANFYSGAIPSVIGTTQQELTEDEAEFLDAQWLEKASNMPRWLGNGVEMSESPFNPEKAQLTESRGFQVGEVARMFNMPGPLLEYQMSGSSLVYRNETGIWLDFRQRCLGPIFAEPIEQQMSDMLTRSHTARFNYDQLLRADIKTRYEAYKLGIEAGFLSPEEVRKQEGLQPGGVDFAPVPAALPQAVPTLLPVNRTRSALEDLRCRKCNGLAGRVSGAAEIKCRKCGAMVVAA